MCHLSPRALAVERGGGDHVTLCSVWGTRPDGADYEGGRDLDDLKEFAGENLGPTCALDNPDLCGEAELAELEKYAEKPEADIQAVIDAAAEAVTAAEQTFEAEVEKLQAKYEELSAEKDQAIKDAKTPELKTAKAVLGYLKRKAAAPAGKDEL